MTPHRDTGLPHAYTNVTSRESMNLDTQDRASPSFPFDINELYSLVDISDPFLQEAISYSCAPPGSLLEADYQCAVTLQCSCHTGKSGILWLWTSSVH
jgi:hypothetical protein